jgi:hypothetical protein
VRDRAVTSKRSHYFEITPSCERFSGNRYGEAASTISVLLGGAT